MKERCLQEQPLKTLVQLRDAARRDKTGFEINEHNLRFHSLPEFMQKVVQNGGRILVDMGGNIFILGWQDKRDDDTIKLEHDIKKHDVFER